MKPNIQIKRVYEPASKTDGYRVLVDRLWPRGIKKENAQLDEWLKEIAPSTELRKWFDHDTEKFLEFSRRYKVELKSHQTELKKLLKSAGKKPLTLLYSAKDEQHNQAVVLRQVLSSLV